MYCIHCGVELREGTAKCPLCGTDYEAVMAALQPQSAYPKNTNHDLKRIRKARLKYAGILLTIAAVLAAGICFLVDLLDRDGITWSRYVLLSVALFWVALVLPFFVSKRRLLIFSVSDAVASILYVYLISHLMAVQVWAQVACGAIALGWCIVCLPLLLPRGNKSLCGCIVIDGTAIMLFSACVERIFGGSWAAPVAVPITVCFCVLLLLVLLCGKKEYGIFVLAAKFFLASALLCLTVNGVLNRYLGHTPLITWAWVVALVCVPLAAIALALGTSKRLRAFLRKHFYV